MKKKVKIIIDVIMYAIFIYLMGYRLLWNLNIHAILGITLFVLFIIHHILNYKWYKSILKGKYNFQRILLTSIDVLLLIAMIFMIISAILLSGAVTTISKIPMTETARVMHIVSTAWGFVLMTIHVGLHLKNLFIKLGNKFKNTNFEYCYYFVIIILLVFGAYSFIKSNLWCDMFMIDRVFLMNFNKIYFVIEKIGITLFFTIILYAMNIFKKKSKC